jgi:hypothetical protein
MKLTVRPFAMAAAICFSLSLPAGYYYLQVSLADGSTAHLPFVKQ